MKKKISLLLVVALILSILPLGTFSVGATASPSYLVADFEDGNVGNIDGNTFGLVDGPGVAKYAVQITDGSKVPVFDFCLLGSLSGATEYINGTKVTSKRIYDVSAWIRADAQITSDKVDFEFTTEGGAVEYTHTVNNAGLVQGEWVKVETTIEYSGSHIATEGTVEVYVSDGIAYTMDDLTLICGQYQPIQGQGVNPVYPSPLGAQTSIGTSADTAVNGWYTYGAAPTMTSEYVGTEVQLTDSTTERISGNAVSVVGSSAAAQVVCKSINIKYGTTYTVYFMAKADNDVAATGKVYLIFSRKNRNDTENLTSNYLYVTPTSVLPAEDGTTLTKEWRRYAASFTYTDHTYNTVLPNLSIGVRTGPSTYVDGLPDFSIANFRIYQQTGSSHTNLQPTGAFEVLDTGNNCFSITGSSGTTLGEVTNTITRIMAPFGDDHVIVHAVDEWDNKFSVQIQSDEAVSANGFKMSVCAKDKDNYFGPQITRSNYIAQVSSSVYTEFDQPVWASDMPELSATVNYNAPSGSDEFIALCGMYDENGKMVSSDIQNLTLTAGEGAETLTMKTAPTATDAKIFLWEAETQSPVIKEVCRISKTTDANFIYVDAERGKSNTTYGYDNPLLTVDDAITALTQLKSTNPKDTYVIMMPGNHSVSSTLNIGSSATSADYDVVFTSYSKNDRAVISGGTDLTGEFTQYKGNIWRAPVPVGTLSRQLFVDDVKATVARSRDLVANEFVNTSTYNGTTFVSLGNLETTHSEHVAKLKEINANGRIDDVEFVFFSLWTNPRCQAASMTEEEDGTISLTMDEGWKYVCNKGASHAYSPKYYENALELLDEENEWYLDSDGGYVYYWPREGVDIKTAKVTLPTFDAYEQPLMKISGTASSFVNNLTFDNIMFADVTWTRPSTVNGHSDAQNNHIRQNGDHLADGVIDVYYANNLNFVNNKFTRLGTTALRLLDGTKYSTVIGNEFYDLSSGAINVGDPSTGASYRFPSDENLLEYISVENNYVHNVARDHWSAAAMSAGYPANTNFSHNEICNIPYSAFHIGYGWDTGIQSVKDDDGNVISASHTPVASVNLDITDNYIHDLFQGTIYDGGAIYTNGITGGTVDNPNLITGNYITDIGPGAAFLYNDQGSSNYQVSDNVCDNSNIWGEYDVTSGKWKGPSGWMNVNLSAKKFEHNLKWFNNYTVNTNYYVGSIAAADTSCRFDESILVDNQTGEWCDDALAIIENAGIEEQYRINFQNGLQKINVLDSVDLNVGESFSNVPGFATSKRSIYKSNGLTYTVKSSDPSVVSVSGDILYAVGAGTATVTYSAIENGVMYKNETKVTIYPGVIEFENCHDNSLGVNQNLTGIASGDKYVYANFAEETPQLSTKVTIPVSGTYTIKYRVGCQLNTYVSPITIKLGDTVVGTNDSEFVQNLYDLGLFPFEHAPMCEYERTIPLEAGTYDLTVDIGLTTDNVYKYQLDYISFEL